MVQGAHRGVRTKASRAAVAGLSDGACSVLIGYVDWLESQREGSN